MEVDDDIATRNNELNKFDDDRSMEKESKDIKSRDITYRSLYDILKKIYKGRSIGCRVGQSCL